jgi:K+-sensing histidine kinase KdpD
LGIGTARLISENKTSMEALRQSYKELTRDVWRKSSLTKSDIHYECDADGTVRRVRSNGTGALGGFEFENEGISLDGVRLSIPVRIRGEVVGSVGFSKSEDDTFWTADEISLLETLTSQLSLALDSARLFTESQRRAERERLVAEITSKIRTTNDPDKILETAAAELKTALQADQARFQIITNGHGKPDDDVQHEAEDSL